MNKLGAFLAKELREMVLPTLTFFVAFEIMVLALTLLDAPLSVHMTTTSRAAVSALILGKSILIADHLPIMGWFREPRMVLNVLWRACNYLGISMAFQVLESLLRNRSHGIAGALALYRDELQWPHFLATHMVLGTFLCFYSFATATVGLVGKARFREHFFGITPSPPSA